MQIGMVERSRQNASTSHTNASPLMDYCVPRGRVVTTINIDNREQYRHWI